jgi:hypothetical protein
VTKGKDYRGSNLNLLFDIIITEYIVNHAVYNIEIKVGKEQRVDGSIHIISHNVVKVYSSSLETGGRKKVRSPLKKKPKKVTR